MTEPTFDLPSHIELTNCETGEAVRAEFVRLDRHEAATSIDGVWWEGLGKLLVDPANEPDRDWEWREIVSYFQNKPQYRSLSVRTPDGKIQAAMVFQVRFKSQIEEGKAAVFVDRLATAPENRGKLVQNPTYRGGGTGLLAYAISQSYFLGLEGRVALIPVANVDWYERKGFIGTDTEINEGIIYELPKDRAIRFLIEKGLLDER